ncbi:hypothetical protein Droror1_Dr00007046 [Drosera rotundifolia]
MGSETACAAQDGRNSDDDEEYEEPEKGNRLLGFMFGNVDDSGELDVDYLDEDAKEHLAALADKLGSSLTEINLSAQAGQSSATAVDEDYDEKAEDAVNYEDIDEPYEGPEIQTATEEDYLLPKKEYLSSDVSLTLLEHKSSIFDDENYDDEEDDAKDHGLPASNDEIKTAASPGTPLDQSEGKQSEVVENGSHVLESAVEQWEHDSAAFTKENLLDGVDQLGSDGNDTPAYFADTEQEDEAAAQDEPSSAKSSSELPVLYIEDGYAILRFSEIFGVQKPLKKREKREHFYSIAKDRYASPFYVEEDEEAFLKGSSRDFRFGEPSVGTSVLMDVEFDEAGIRQRTGSMAPLTDYERRDTCVCAEPLRENLSLDLSAGLKPEMNHEFYPLDQQDWEDEIIWDDSSVVTDHRDCVRLSDLDRGTVVNDGEEIESQLQVLQSDFRIEQDEKESACFIGSRPVCVEPFDARGRSGAELDFPHSESTHHPQLLRLESRIERDTSDFVEGRENASEELQHGFLKRFSKLALQNKELNEGSWLNKIIWEPGKPTSKPKLILDLLDEQMLFEVLDYKDYELLQCHARAMVVTRPNSSGATDPVEQSGYAALSGGRFNISNDKFYANRKSSPQLKSLSKKRNTHGVKILHSIPALKLETIKPRLSNKDIANFHRPKSLWYPHDNEVVIREQEKLPTRGPKKIIIKSLGGKGSKIHVNPEETLLSVKEKASKKLEFSSSETVKIFYSGKELVDHQTLSQQNVRPNSLLHLVRTNIHVLPMAHKLPGENKSLRPPGAFKKKSDLSVKDGHVFLLEYCEERPLLLGNPGMGARLCTYYQKSSSDDQTGDMLRSRHSNLGTVLTLDPADKSPFLGDIKPGSFQSSLETNMYRAPIFPHEVASSDYLLIRSAKGKLSIRRIDRINIAGQQEPHIEVMSPVAKGLQTYLMNRLLVFMYREFRAAEKRGVLPSIRADELSAQFPNINEPFLRKRLKHCAELQRGPKGQLLWVMRRNFNIPSEEQLRRLVSPENVCAYESMQAGMYRLKRLGITRLAHLTGLTQLAALSSAMNQLPDEAIALAAASHIERELQITPWNLSNNFVACTAQGRENIERLEITGVGDPSGRGLGFSYVRFAPKAPISNTMVKKKPIVARGTTVTGTDADLRRLSMEASKEVLLKFNVSEEQIAKLTRWHRIAMIRKLSSEQAVSGVEVDPTMMNKFARGQRMSFLQLQQQTREKCQEIWERQVQSLSAVDYENESDSEANSDLDSFAGDLENLLDAEECEGGEDGKLDYKHDRLEGVKGLKIRRNPTQSVLEEEFEDEAAEAAELCRMLMDDEDGKKKKKKKTRAVGDDVAPGILPNLVAENAERPNKTNVIDKEATGLVLFDGPSTSKQNAFSDQNEVDYFPAKKAIAVNAKAITIDDVLSSGELKKKLKIMTDGFKPIKEKKPARETFTCGACGQLGHMRTNKHCPRYREDPEALLNMIDQDRSSSKPRSPDSSAQTQQRSQPKMLIPRDTPKVPVVEIPDVEPSSSKAKVLKVKCNSMDKFLDKVTNMPSQSSELPATSETETGSRPAPKVSKIKFTSKIKHEESQAESHKPSIIILPPSEMGRDPPRQRVVIKRPKDIVNLDQLSNEGNVDVEHIKTKKIVDLTGSERRLEAMSYAEEPYRGNTRESKRFWEEEEKRRYAERHMEEEKRNYRHMEEEKRLLEEQASLAELRKFEEIIRKEREEEALKKKKQKKSSEVKDEYLGDYRTKSNSRWATERDRTAKRKTVVELEKYAAEYVPPTKRRRGGEVLLANILENIIDSLRQRRDISFLFLLPVTKKEAPDYLDIVKHPMDLSTIRKKVKNLEYKDRYAFRYDVHQIQYNAHLYNEVRHPGIPPLADKLMDYCDHLLNENDANLTEAEAACQ